MCIRDSGCSPRHRTHRNSAHRSCWQAQDGASGVGRPPEGLLQVAMKRIGLLTSGGDASGMNAAIRAVARTAASMGCLLYTSDAADDLLCVDLGGRRIIKKKKKKKYIESEM